MFAPAPESAEDPAKIMLSKSAHRCQHLAPPRPSAVQVQRSTKMVQVPRNQTVGEKSLRTALIFIT